MTVNVRMYDGQPVVQFGARLTSFDIEDEDVDEFYDGQVIVGVFVGTVDGSSHKTLLNGDHRRDNRVSIRCLRVAKGDMRHQLIEVFGLDDSDQLELDLAPAVRAPGRGPSAPAEVTQRPPDVPTQHYGLGIEGGTPNREATGTPPPPRPAADDDTWFSEELAPAGSVVPDRAPTVKRVSPDEFFG